MRTARPSSSPARTRSRTRRGTALVALGTVALVGAAPAAAFADDVAPEAPAPDATPDAAAAADIALPAETPVDQVPAPVEEPVAEVPALVEEPAPAAQPVAEAPAAEQPAPVDVVEQPAAEPAADQPADQPVDQPADQPTDQPGTDAAPDEGEAPVASEEAPEGEVFVTLPAAVPGDVVLPAADAEPSEPGCVETVPGFPFEGIEGCYGTGKVSVSASSQVDGMNLAGAVFEVDVEGTEPGPEWTGTTDADGLVLEGFTVPAGTGATLSIVSAPAGSMVVGATSATYAACEVPVFIGCPFDLDVELVEAYRVLDVDVRSGDGVAVPGASFELWGAPTPEPVEEEPVEVVEGEPELVQLLAPAPSGLVRLGSATTDAAGRLTFGQVAPGAYQLRSTAVPEGFEELAATVPLTVDPVLTVAEADATPVVVPVTLDMVVVEPPVVVPPVVVPAPVVPVAAPVVPVAVAAAPVRTAVAAPARPLAATGAEPVGLVAAAGTLLALGVAATAAARRATRRA